MARTAKKAAPAKKGGRPSKYRPEFDEQARKLCLLGATDQDLADFFEVSEDTINTWKKVHREFSESIKKGKTLADAEVAMSLFKRATGYIGQKTVTATFEGEITDTKVVDDYVGPDTTAGIFWLKNRQSGRWREKQQVEHTGANGGPIEQRTAIVDENQIRSAVDKLEGEY